MECKKSIMYKITDIVLESKNNVWHDTSSLGKNGHYIRLRSTKLIFVGYGQLNFTTILDFCTRYA